MSSNDARKIKLLCAFDFDETIIDENSDKYILKLIPQGKSLPENVIHLHSRSGWIEYMSKIFVYLQNIGITKHHILSCLEEIPFVNGLKDLFVNIKNLGGDIIIISDSNSVFINHILKHHNLDNMVSAVFTNKSYFEGDLLKICGYHEQDWCSLSTSNLCKGHILKDFINQSNSKGIHYDIVAFIGDGWNDLCPSLKLSSNDLIFPRTGFNLHKELGKYDQQLKALVFPWNSGHDIAEKLVKAVSNS